MIPMLWFARAVAAIVALGIAGSAAALDIPVNSAIALRTAIENADPGDRILIAAGTYTFSANLVCDTIASTGQPIEVRAVQPRSVLIRFDGGGGIAEGFRVVATGWRFEGLDIEGACAVDTNCEHAFHLAGDADGTVIRDNRVRDFNAQIKSNGAAPNATAYPDDVLIERNVFYDSRARNTANPVAKIDVVGGRRWVVRANAIYDYQKLGGDTVSYAAFLKGNSRDGLFERNLVVCTRNFSGGVRLGLSFGGGGSSPNSICEEGSCTPEHQNGVMRNNLILACNDVGIYLNKAGATRIEHNTLYATTGIDVRYPESTATVRNNLVSGGIRDRNLGSSAREGNIIGISDATYSTWFADPAAADFGLLDGTAFVDAGVAAPLVTNDHCGNARDDGLRDIGAFEYDADFACDTRVAGGKEPSLFANGFESP